jgi:HAE1 family hydrophobic/amphiphilic exporter-1
MDGFPAASLAFSANVFLVFLTRFSLKNPIAITLFYILIVLLGGLAIMRMGRSILPPVAFPVVSVTAPYPGAGPDEIERLVIEPIEDQLEGLPDLDRISASSQNGIAVLSVQFRFGSNLEVNRTNVQQAVDAARPNMPNDLIPPLVSKTDPAQAPVLEESVSSAVLDPGEVSQLLDREIVPALRAARSVSGIAVSGSFVRQFTVDPQAGRLEALRASPLDIFRSVEGANDILPGGQLRSPLQQSTIGIRAAATSAAALRNVALSIPGGPSARLADAARVSDGYADQTVIARVDGEPAAILYVSKAAGEDSLGAIASARAEFATLAKRFPLVRFEELRTDGPYTKAAVAGVLQTLGEGVVLTVFVMLLFLHAWRSATIAAIAIPTSLCAAFIAMWTAGFTVNVLSLMGLSLTIGILVDDSIVIIEAIARHAARGLEGDDAALAGRKELGGAAIAITLVDVAVFAPIALMSGIVGEFMREFGLVIVFATGFSLLVSLTLTPLLAARWALRRETATLDDKSYAQVYDVLSARSRLFPWTFRGRAMLGLLARWHSTINAFNAAVAQIAGAYAHRWLPAAMQRRRGILVAAALACVASLVPVFSGAIPSEFSPPVNRGSVTVDLTFAAGTPLVATDAAASRITAALLDDSRVSHVEASAGRAFNGSTDIFGSNVAQLGIVLSDPQDSGDALLAKVKALNALAPGASIAGAGKGMGGTPPVSYNIGGTPQAIDLAARRIASALRENPYATDVRSSNGGLGPRIQIDIDSRRAQLLNVSPDDAAQTARLATGGTIAAKARLASGLVNVVVQADAGESGDLEQLKRFTVRSSDGKLIPLGLIARITRESEPTVIQRENRERVVTVSANTVDAAPIGLVSGPMQRLLRDPNFLPPGARIERRGDVAQFLDTVSKMMAALSLSLIAIYGILAILYRSYKLPLVIMLTVPLASVGAFGTLYLFNMLRGFFPGVALFSSQTLNLYSMLGIIMLVGLVAKNGILLVEFAERAVREGASPKEAMRDAAQRRFRPILMTTLAMIAGMLPLALGDTIGAEYRKALGTVVIGGLTSSLS